MNIEPKIDLDAQKKRDIAYTEFFIETFYKFSVDFHKANESDFIKAKEGTILAELLKYPKFKHWDNPINLLSRKQALDLLLELNRISKLNHITVKVLLLLSLFFIVKNRRPMNDNSIITKSQFLTTFNIFLMDCNSIEIKQESQFYLTLLEELLPTEFIITELIATNVEKKKVVNELEKKVASLIPFFPFEHENKEFH